MGKISSLKEFQKRIEKEEQFDKRNRKREINKSIRRCEDISNGSSYKKTNTRFNSLS